MKIYHSQSGYNSGRLSKKLTKKEDLAQYKNGVFDSDNVIFLKHGPAMTRPGWLYGMSVKSLDLYQRIIPFSVSSTINILIEVGVGYFRFHTYDGTNLGTIPDSTDPNIPCEVVNTFTEAQVKNMSWAQSGNKLYIAYGGKQKELTLYDYVNYNDWDLVDSVFLDGPYLDMNAFKEKKLQPSATTGSGITITASGTGFTPFTSAWVGRHIRIHNHASATQWGWGKVVEYVDSTHVKVDIIEDFATTNATSYWRLGEWSDATGYPRQVTIHQGRLIFGNWGDRTMAVAGSNLFTYMDFSPSDANGTVTGDHSFVRDLAGRKRSEITWMESFGASLVVGGLHFETSLFPSGPTLSPLDISSKEECRYGSLPNTPPVKTPNNIIFIERLGRRVRSIAYEYISDSYKGPDLTLFADEITSGGIAEIVMQEQPQSVIWGRLNNGSMIGLTYDDEQKIYAWHAHMQNCTCLVKSLAVMPSHIHNQDMLFAIVERTIAGTTHRNIEMLSKYLDVDVPGTDRVFLDSAVVYNGPSVQSFSAGLEHLEGATVRVVSDRAIIDDALVVTDGTITLSEPVTHAVVGIPYDHHLETMPFKSPNPATLDYDLASLSLTQLSVTTMLTNALKVRQYGASKSTVLYSRRFEDNMDEAPSDYALSEKVSSLTRTWTSDMRLVFEGEPGLGMMLVGYSAEIEAGT